MADRRLASSRQTTTLGTPSFSARLFVNDIALTRQVVITVYYVVAGLFVEFLITPNASSNLTCRSRFLQKKSNPDYSRNHPALRLVSYFQDITNNPCFHTLKRLHVLHPLLLAPLILLIKMFQCSISSFSYTTDSKFKQVRHTAICRFVRLLNRSRVNIYLSTISQSLAHISVVLCDTNIGCSDLQQDGFTRMGDIAFEQNNILNQTM